MTEALLLLAGFVLGVAADRLAIRRKRVWTGKKLAQNLFEEMSAPGFDTAGGTISPIQTSVFDGQRQDIAESLPDDLAKHVTRYYQTLIHFRDNVKQNRNDVADLLRRRNALLPRLEAYSKRSELNLLFFGRKEST